MGEQHTFSAISGFGLRVVPRAPYRARLGPSPNELDVEHDAAEGGRFARVVADQEGGYTSKLDSATPSLYDVLDVEAGPRLDRWHLDARAFLAPIPAGFTLHSVDARSVSPFDLMGPNDTLIYAQAPRQLPAIEALCGPGQTVLDQGEDWVEVTYQHQGQDWWQRHQLCALRGLGLVFTAQALSEYQAEALTGLSVVLQGLVPGAGVARDPSR